MLIYIRVCHHLGVGAWLLQMSRRAKTVEIQIPRREKGEPLHVVVDGGEGVWRGRVEGSPTRSWQTADVAEGSSGGGCQRKGCGWRRGHHRRMDRWRDF